MPKAASKTVDLTTGSPQKRMLYFAVPLLIGSLFQELYNAVDTLVVGKFAGAGALGSVGAAGVPFMLVNALAGGFSVGASILSGQYLGARKKDMLKEISGTVFLLSLLLGLLGSIGLYYLCGPLLCLVNVTETLRPGAQLYLQTISLFICPMVLYNNIAGLLRGIGNSKAPLIFLIVCAIVNTVLDLWFVISFRWGAFGVALATGISQTLSALLGIGYVLTAVPELRPRRKNLRMNPDILKKMLRLGFPHAIQNATAITGMLLLQRIINSYGDTVITAYALGAKVNTFIQLPITSMSSTLSAFTAQNWGAGEEGRMKQGIAFSMKLTLGFTALVSVGVILFRHELIGLFTQKEETDIIRVGAEFLMSRAGFYVVLAVMYLFQGVFNGVGDTITTMLAMMAMTVIRLPMAYIFTGPLGMDYRGAWITFPITWCIGAAVMFFRYKSGAWRQKALKRSAAPGKMSENDRNAYPN